MEPNHSKNSDSHSIEIHLFNENQEVKKVFLPQEWENEIEKIVEDLEEWLNEE